MAAAALGLGLPGVASANREYENGEKDIMCVGCGGVGAWVHFLWYCYLLRTNELTLF